MSKYYAVVWGDRPGVYQTWSDAQKAIGRNKAPLVKIFTSMQEAQLFSRKNSKAHLRAAGSQIPMDNRSIAHVAGCAQDGRVGYALHVLDPSGRSTELCGFLDGARTEIRAELCGIYALLSNFTGAILVVCSEKLSKQLAASSGDQGKLADGDLVGPVLDLMAGRDIAFASSEGRCRETASRVARMADEARLQDEQMLEQEYE